MLWRASDVDGTATEVTDGSIGSVDDFLFSDDRWTVRRAVIDTGNWLTWPTGSPAAKPIDAPR